VRLDWLTLAALAAVVFHAPLLRLPVRYLIVEEPPLPSDLVVIVSGDGRHQIAAQMLRDGTARQILLFESPPRRVVMSGIIPASHVSSRQELIRLGVPEESVVLAAGEFNGEWRDMRILDQWLGEHPQPATILCRRLDTRRLACVLDRVVAPERRPTIRIQAIPSRFIDENRWWVSRAGWMANFSGWLDLAYLKLVGEDTSGEPTRTPDEYEQFVLQRWSVTAR
jgi:hypothetical protein